METESPEIRKIEYRCTELESWILNNAPRCLIESRHLVAGSRDRAYWAFGYLTALQDVMRLMSRGVNTPSTGKDDETNSRYAA